MTKDYVLNNTSFVLAGHNIKWFAVLGLETLSKNCSIPKEQIYYFDDFSTDGSKEEIEGRGFKVITWDKLLYRNFRHSSLAKDLCVRVDQIVLCVMKQINSKYLCMLDGDTAYSGDAVSYMLSKALEDEVMPDIFGIKRTAREAFPGCGFLKHNIWQNYMWIDLEKANKEGILDPSLSEIIGYYDTARPSVFNAMYDTGGYLYNRVKNSNMNAKLLDMNYMDLPWIDGLLCLSNHLGWLSSSMRNDTMYAGDWEELGKRLEEKIRKSCEGLCREVGLDIEIVISELLNGIKGSVIYE